MSTTPTNHHFAMSSSTPPTPASAAVASAQKIKNYTQSISSGVTNLLTELGRVSVSADTNVSNHVIMAQLQALHTLVDGISTRLAAVEKSSAKPEDDVPDPIEIEPEVSYAFPNRTAGFVNHPNPMMESPLTWSSEYNAIARSYNATISAGNDTLMPLRTVRNTYIVGFPSTLGHLVSLGLYASPNLFNVTDKRAQTPRSRRYCGRGSAY